MREEANLAEGLSVVNLSYVYTISGLGVVVTESFLIFIGFSLFLVLSNLDYSSVD